jgi:uncharacterized Ntn-hydrolase superfamily protein
LGRAAALLVVKPKGGYGGFNDRYLDLRVDDYQQPVDGLERIAALWRPYFKKPTENDLDPIDNGSPTSCAMASVALGYDPGPDAEAWGDQAHRAFRAFSEMENLEDRLRPDGHTARLVLVYFREGLSARGR